MTWQFFPSNRYFWISHVSCAIIILAFFLTEVTPKNPMYSMLVTGNLVWQCLFLAAGLCFRALTLKTRLNKKPILIAIAVALGYACLSGLVMAILTVAITVPFFWYHFQSVNAVPALLNPRDFIPSQILNLWKITQLFISAWAFVYISILMKKNVKESELSNLRLQNSLKEAQLNSLSSQLNPHFLFNALNNIRFMMHEDVRAADTMITSISEILRHSLESNKKEKVTIDHEMDIIKKYIGLSKIQLENRLRFSLSIPSAVQHCLIPPMLLQILIENAIKHGIDNIQGGGELKLEVLEMDHHLVCSIINDVPAIEKHNPAYTGIGLKNIQQRLALLYGDNASLELLKSSTNFQAVIKLPKEFTP